MAHMTKKKTGGSGEEQPEKGILPDQHRHKVYGF